MQKAKPDPEGFLAVIARTGVLAKQALIFEDSAAGFVAANSAEIDFCDVRFGLFTSWKSDSTLSDC